MRLKAYIAALHAALFAILLGVSPAGSGSLSLLGVGKSAGAVATPPTVSFVGTFAQSGDPAHTATVNIGNPAYIATRRVIVVVAGGFNFGTLNPLAQINSVNCDYQQVIADTNGVMVTVLSAIVPSGTTSVPVAWTFSTSVFNNNDVAVYIVDNSLLTNPTSPVANYTSAALTSGVTTGSTSVATLSGGFLLSAAYTGGASTPPTITSSTAGIADDISSGAAEHGHANNTSATGSSSATWTWGSGFVGQGNVALIAWR